MRRVLSGALAAGAVAGIAILNPVAAAVAQSANTPADQMAAAASEYQQTQQQMLSLQGSVVQLGQQLAQADLQIVAAQQRVASDKQREDGLRQRIGEYARSAYQTEGSQLSQVLEAQSVGEVLDVVAEARVIAERQRSLLDQIVQLRRSDEAIRDQAQAARDTLAKKREDALQQIRTLESKLESLAAAVAAAGQVLAGAAAGQVPANRLAQTTGADGQCTWYGEQAWVTYSDPSSPTLTGDGADVVPNLARAMSRSVELEPQPGSLVSWQRPLMSPNGHVALVAAVDRDPSGAVTGYTVWEMNYVGAFQTDARHVSWSGPSSQVLFLSPPQPVDPIMEELQKYGPGG
jgi:peptidoglycan hydrolase CwlO-like protein